MRRISNGELLLQSSALTHNIKIFIQTLNQGYLSSININCNVKHVNTHSSLIKNYYYYGYTTIYL